MRMTLEHLNEAVGTFQPPRIDARTGKEEVYWITFAGRTFTGLTADQCHVLWMLASDTLGYEAINWNSAPDWHPAGGPYNTPTHAEVKSNA